MKKIGFIGLGQMGLPMALNLCRAGFPLLVKSSNPASAAEIEALGGTSVASYQEMAAQADVIITIVPADKEILDLYTVPGGLLDSMKPGAVCIDMTSAQGSTMRVLQSYVDDHGLDIKVMDAPVSGGVAGAVSGKLTIMVGCESQQLFDSQQDVLKAMGEKIYYTGLLGSGSDIKMINQMINAANTVIAAESIAMAKQLGVNLDTLVEIVNQSSGGSYIYERNVPKYMLTGDHTPGFRLDLMKKDVSLYMEAAKGMQAVMPLCEMTYQVYKATSNQGKGSKNYTCVLEWVEENQKKVEE